jgi:hypothetical protein
MKYKIVYKDQTYYLFYKSRFFYKLHKTFSNLNEVTQELRKLILGHIDAKFAKQLTLIPY